LPTLGRLDSLTTLYRGASILLFLAFPLVLHADPPPRYYDSAQGKTGAELRAALHAIIHNQHALPYTGSTHPHTGDAIRDLDQDPANTNNVLAIYSRYSIAKTNLGSAAGTWNREHRWCDSYGLNGTPPAYTDLNNLCAEEAVVNSTRGNNYFDVSSPAASGYKTYTNTAAGVTWSRTTATWEPSDVSKGYCARAMLYMTTRYTGDAANEPKLTLTDNTSLIVSGSTYMGRYTALLKWHFQHPVDAAERARNEVVYSYQTNRNPFIDHPEWVAMAFIPPLIVGRASTNIILSWTNDYAPTMVAEQSADLLSTWSALTNSPVLTSSNVWIVTIPLQATPHFYRARLQ
jgi:endonuclease I